MTVILWEEGPLVYLWLCSHPHTVLPQHLIVTYGRFCHLQLTHHRAKHHTFFPQIGEGKIPTSLLTTWSTTFIKLHMDWGKRTWKCTVYSKIGGGTNSKETMWDQHATAISGWDCRSSESKSKGLFWNLFLSWPQAALASRPLVCRVLTVILRDSKAAANAITCQMI